MAALSRLVGERKSAIGDGYGVFVDLLLRSIGTKAGVAVTRDKALQVATVFACCRVLMDGVAQVPFKVMRKTKSPVSLQAQREEADEHPLYDVLQCQPNSWQSSFEFREQLMLHVLLGRRGAFAYKNIIDIGTGGPRTAELILLDPERVTPMQAEDYTITYQVRGKSGEALPLPQSMIWHVRGPSWDGLNSLDVLSLAREAIGLAKATEETHSSLHANGVRPSGVLSMEGTLSPKQQEDITNWLKKQAAAENTGSPLIIDRGAKWLSQALSGVDSQHLETRRHQIEEICRFFRVMPIMVGYSDKTATFASAEAMFLAHIVHTLMPWYQRIQSSADVSLLTRADRQAGYYTKLVERGLLRGDMKATGEYLGRLTLGGIMVRNEARALLDLNPIEGLDDPLTPTNMTNDPSGAPAAALPGA